MNDGRDGCEAGLGNRIVGIASQLTSRSLQQHGTRLRIAHRVVCPHFDPVVRSRLQVVHVQLQQIRCLHLRRLAVLFELVPSAIHLRSLQLRKRPKTEVN